MKVANGVFWDLRHGVHLAIWNTSGRLGIRVVADFLANAIEHFKHHRDNLKTGLYTGGPYCQTAKERRRVLGTMQLSCRNKEVLDVALWADAVIHAYTDANAVEQMLEALPAWQEAVEREGGYLREMVAMLDRPGGDLMAMAAMIKRGLTKDQEAGHYKPGEIVG